MGWVWGVQHVSEVESTSCNDSRWVMRNARSWRVIGTSPLLAADHAPAHCAPACRHGRGPGLAAAAPFGASLRSAARAGRLGRCLRRPRTARVLHTFCRGEAAVGARKVPAKLESLVSTSAGGARAVGPRSSAGSGCWAEGTISGESDASVPCLPSCRRQRCRGAELGSSWQQVLGHAPAYRGACGSVSVR